MTIEKSIQRLIWRFTNGKFEPNQNDKESLKFICEWINREKEQRINQNRYFAKIIIYCFIHELNFYNDKHFSERKIQEILELPLEHWYSEFREHINRHELNIAFNKMGIEYPYSDKNEVEQKISLNKQKFKENEEYAIKSLDKYSQEQVTKRLNIFITELLNKYGNMP